jgi:hypothetical protein
MADASEAWPGKSNHWRLGWNMRRIVLAAKWTVVVTVLFSAASAAFWLWAAVLPIPQKVWIQARAGAGGPSEDLDVVLRTLKQQSKLNAAAASSMFIAVLFQLWGALTISTP